MLRDEKYTGAYLPLYCDPSNGAGVYLIGRDRFDESAMIQIFRDRTETDINVMRRMIVSQDTLDDSEAAQKILCNSGFDEETALALVKRRTKALETAKVILEAQGYKANDRKKILKEYTSNNSKLLTKLESDPSQYSGDPRVLVEDSVYDDEVLRGVLYR